MPALYPIIQSNAMRTGNICVGTLWILSAWKHASSFHLNLHLNEWRAPCALVCTRDKIRPLRKQNKTLQTEKDLKCSVHCSVVFSLFLFSFLQRLLWQSSLVPYGFNFYPVGPVARYLSWILFYVSHWNPYHTRSQSSMYLSLFSSKAHARYYPAVNCRDRSDMVKQLVPTVSPLLCLCGLEVHWNFVLYWCSSQSTPSSLKQHQFCTDCNAVPGWQRKRCWWVYSW